MDPSFLIVISRGLNRYVVEFYEEKEEPSHDEEMVSGTSIEKSIATKQHEQSIPLASPPFKTFILIDQRKWNDIHAVSYVKREPKKVTYVSRHQGRRSG